MDQTELLRVIAEAFERHGIIYAVTGSHASFAYGEQRFTNDIDVIARIDAQQLDLLMTDFPTDQYYVSDIGAKHAVAHGGQFNIIHPQSGLKIDVIVPLDPKWPDHFARRVKLPTSTNRDVWFISPEDLILRKMDFYMQGESERHLRDIASMLKISREQIDRAYIKEWADRLGLQDIWSEVSNRVP